MHRWWRRGARSGYDAVSARVFFSAGPRVRPGAWPWPRPPVPEGGERAHRRRGHGPTAVQPLWAGSCGAGQTAPCLRGREVPRVTGKESTAIAQFCATTLGSREHRERSTPPSQARKRGPRGAFILPCTNVGQHLLLVGSSDEGTHMSRGLRAAAQVQCAHRRRRRRSACRSRAPVSIACSMPRSTPSHRPVKESAQGIVTALSERIPEDTIARFCAIVRSLPGDRRELNPHWAHSEGASAGHRGHQCR